MWEISIGEARSKGGRVVGCEIWRRRGQGGWIRRRQRQGMCQSWEDAPSLLASPSSLVKLHRTGEGRLREGGRRIWPPLGVEDEGSGLHTTGSSPCRPPCCLIRPFPACPLPDLVVPPPPRSMPPSSRSPVLIAASLAWSAAPVVVTSLAGARRRTHRYH